MTGRRLYDAITDAWAAEGFYSRSNAQFLGATPPAWSFLAWAERKTLNRAAAQLTPRPKKSATPASKS